GAMAEALARARAGEPSLVEARTYRYKGHSMSDPQKYRTHEDVEPYRARDPIESLRSRMEEAGILGAAEWEELVAAADAIVEDAVTFAEASAEPAPGELYEDVYADSPRSAGRAR
ncbi:MAG: thiamine pyrophosphate-dependent enzyme, partial [Spirochaetaceae bacterium]|nr:thiamine pyrophosphate-dependent enzyme [Spirochaetaceae bacterium]